MRPYIEHLKPHDSVQDVFWVKEKARGVGKTGKPFLALTLSDRSGVMEARVWDRAEEWEGLFDVGDFIRVEASVQSFQNRRQMVIRKLTRVAPEEVDPTELMPVADQDAQGLFTELDALLGSLESEPVRWLARELLHDPNFKTRFLRAPAARSVHHARLGGLLEHTLSVVKVADKMAAHYPMLDRNLLLFGAAFHDFGKVLELTYEQGFSYSLEGRLVGHLVMATQWIDRICAKRPDFPEDLKWLCQHLILSHHGELAFGSPKEPQIIEAVVVHLIDNLDSKIDSISMFFKEGRVGSGQWTGHHKHYDNYYFCPKNSALDRWLHPDAATAQVSADAEHKPEQKSERASSDDAGAESQESEPFHVNP